MFAKRLARRNIYCQPIDAGDALAGAIHLVKKAGTKEEYSEYNIDINKNHKPPVQFPTLAHELAHLFLGHLGPDNKIDVPKRQPLDEEHRELEAESTAYIVCKRNAVEVASGKYPSNFVKSDTTCDQIDVYQIMRAAGRIESVLEIAYHARFDEPEKISTRDATLFRTDRLPVSSGERDGLSLKLAT